MEVFVQRHLREVWHYLRVCGCAPDVADDLTQEVFLVAVAKQLDPEPEATARVFLRRTARFLFLQHRRRMARDRRDASSEAWLDAVDATWEEQQAEHRVDGWLAALRRCQERLRGRRARAVQLFYGESRGRAAVAAALGMTENGVKALLQRVRRDLRACVEQAVRHG